MASKGFEGFKMRGLVSDLAIDGAITLSQAVRHYGVSAQRVKAELPCLEREVKVLRTRKQGIEETFVTLDQEGLRWAPTWTLTHLALTAELRHRLGAHRGAWEREAGYGTRRPDALWHRSSSTWAIEADAGYSKGVVEAKLTSFEQDYETVIWGTASRSRCGRLKLQHAGAQRQFVHLDITDAIKEARIQPASARAVG